MSRAHSLHLPTISGGSMIAAPVHQETPQQTMLRLMREHPLQGRKQLVWNELLDHVAQVRCRDMAQHGTKSYEHHLDSSGCGPDWCVQQAGYKLPEWWTVTKWSNHIESLSWSGGDEDNVRETFDAFVSRGTHDGHILAKIPFYQAQVCMGIAYLCAPETEERHFWCILSAPPQGR